MSVVAADSGTPLRSRERKSGTAEPPAHCPVCGTETEIRKENDAETLYCVNPDCAIKRVKRFALMTSRDAFHIEGLSETTLEKLIQDGRIHPARIEEMIEKARREVDQRIKEAGEQATFETGVHGIHPELVRLLGRMRYALQHLRRYVRQ